MPRLFPISIEVEEDAVGRVLRVLNATAGIAKLHLRLDKEVKPEVPPPQEGAAIAAPALLDGRSVNKRNVPPSENRCYQAIAGVLLKTPAHYKILAAALQRAGFKGTGVHGFIHRMNKMKWIQRTSPGSYKITDRGQRTFGKQNLIPPPGKKPYQSSFYKVTNNYSGFRLFVLTTLNKNGEVSSADMYEFVSDAGFSTKNLSTTGMKLRNEGLISVSDGVYRLTEKGKEVIDNRPSDDDNDLNSNHEGIEANG